MNKVLYAREGARNIMDRTFEDFPWQVRVEVDGVDVEVPEVSNSNYMYIEMLFAFKKLSPLVGLSGFWTVFGIIDEYGVFIIY